MARMARHQGGFEAAIVRLPRDWRAALVTSDTGDSDGRTRPARQSGTTAGQPAAVCAGPIDVTPADRADRSRRGHGLGHRQLRRRVSREGIFQSLVAALTLAMVFVIQHTQARQQAATQRKLDEILQALPGADNSLLTLEHASDQELRAAGHQHSGIRKAALDEQSGSA